MSPRGGAGSAHGRRPFPLPFATPQTVVAFARPTLVLARIIGLDASLLPLWKLGNAGPVFCLLHLGYVCFRGLLRLGMRGCKKALQGPEDLRCFQGVSSAALHRGKGMILDTAAHRVPAGPSTLGHGVRWVRVGRGEQVRVSHHGERRESTSRRDAGSRGTASHQDREHDRQPENKGSVQRFHEFHGRTVRGARRRP